MANFANPPSQAVLDAYARRVESSQQTIQRTEWFIDEVCAKVRISLDKRVRIATELVKSKVVKNISKPVTKGGKFTTGRSKPGEYPRADTTLLMKTIFGEVIQTGDNQWSGYIGTPLDYGVVLELFKNRSFLVRTLDGTRTQIYKILTGPII